MLFTCPGLEPVELERVEEEGSLGACPSSPLHMHLHKLTSLHFSFSFFPPSPIPPPFLFLSLSLLFLFSRCISLGLFQLLPFLSLLFLISLPSSLLPDIYSPSKGAFLHSHPSAPLMRTHEHTLFYV